MPSLKVKEKAVAKLNLSFKVIKRLPSNYHEIDSIVTFPKKIYDNLIIRKAEKNVTKIIGPQSKRLLDQGGDKIMKKTIGVLSSFFSISINLDIILEKNIPLGSGLGGGSSNAAALARAIIKIYSPRYAKKEFLKQLCTIGSDVPVCFFSQNCRVEGQGEKITKLSNLNKKIWVLLITPKRNVSTKFIFNNFTGPYSKKIKNLLFSKSALLSEMNSANNDLQRTIEKNFPDLKELISLLPNKNNVTKPRFTGSGSCIFMLFDKFEDANLYKVINEKLLKSCHLAISDIHI